MLKKYLDSSGLPGVWTALVTPFRGRSVDWDVWTNLVERAAAAGLTGIVVLGTTGESPTVTENERKKLITHAIEVARGRVRVIVGAGSYNLQHAKQNVIQAADLGADGLLIVTPYYNKPTQAGLKNYFLTLAEFSKLPIILYHIPGRCGVGISIPLVLELAQHPRIIGLKDAGGDVVRVGEIARRAPDNFKLLSGDDPLTLPMMSVGAVGVVSVTSNLAPKLVKGMVDSALKGNFTTALQLNRRLAVLNEVLFLETNPCPIKEAMNLAGIRVGPVRPPLAPVTQQTRRAIKKALGLAGELQ